MNGTRFTIEPRPMEFGGGYNAKIFDADDVEIAGGVFPLAEYADAEDPDKEACADAYNWASDELQYL
jgi:hypothetical protein